MYSTNRSNSGPATRVYAVALFAAFAFALFAPLLIPTRALAEGLEPLESANSWQHEYVSQNRYGNTSKSALTTDAYGTLQRVEFTAGKLIVESYSSGYNSPTAQLVVDESTYLPTGCSSDDMLWGGVFGGSDANYVVTGQNNPNEDDSLAVVRVTKYSKSWEYLANREYAGINTYIPFDAGGCDITELDGDLFIKTCHEMYLTSDGCHHQASMAFVIDEATMAPVATMTDVMNVGQTALGYVSHSFNQYLATLGDDVYSVDHGDAAPRSVVVKRFGQTGSSSYGTVLNIGGSSGDNTTYTTVGGVATSSASNTILTVGTQRDQDGAYTGGSDYPYNMWLAVTDASNLASTKVVWLTSYAKGTTVNACNPYIVQVGNDEFLVVWGEYLTGTSLLNGVFTDTIDYVFVDGHGNVTKDLQSFTGTLSDCKPFVTGGQVVWYASGYSYRIGDYPAVPVFYTIDVATKTMVPTGNTGRLSDASVMLLYEGTYTGEEIEPSVYVQFGGIRLEEGTDYKYSFSNNVNAGTATITLEGLGAYAGQTTARYFTIAPADVSEYRLWRDNSMAYTGQPLACVEGLSNSHSGVWLVEGTDYTVEYTDNVNVGTAGFTISGRGNYAGTIEGTFTITRADVASAEVSVASQAYTGSAVEPAVTVTLAGRTLTPGTDYTLSYASNTNPGTATVTVSGQGNYTGTTEQTFQIAWPFTDVDDYTSHAADVLWLASAGISTGFPDGTFRPYASVARCDMAAFLYRLAGSPEFDPATAGVGFSDVDPSTPHYKEIVWLAATGVSKGWDNGDGTFSFRPYAEVARCDMAAFLYRLAGSPGYEPSAADLAYFSDVSEGTPHYREVLWLAHNKISTGWDRSGGTHEFRNYLEVARCDMAAFMRRMVTTGLL